MVRNIFFGRKSLRFATIKVIEIQFSSELNEMSFLDSLGGSLPKALVGSSRSKRTFPEI